MQFDKTILDDIEKFMQLHAKLNEMLACNPFAVLDSNYCETHELASSYRDSINSKCHDNQDLRNLYCELHDDYSKENYVMCDMVLAKINAFVCDDILEEELV